MRRRRRIELRPSCFVSECEDEVRREHAADARGEGEAPHTRAEVEEAAEYEEERGAECSAARSADESRLDNRVAEERLHQRAAHAEARPDEQAEDGARQSQLKEDALV